MSWRHLDAPERLTSHRILPPVCTQIVLFLRFCEEFTLWMNRDVMKHGTVVFSHFSPLTINHVEQQVKRSAWGLMKKIQDKHISVSLLVFEKLKLKWCSWTRTPRCRIVHVCVSSCLTCPSSTEPRVTWSSARRNHSRHYESHCGLYFLFVLFLLFVKARSFINKLNLFIL